MGNRAVIAYESMPEIGIYLHWNGGLESVLAFLHEAKERDTRTPDGDPTYSFARLAQVIAEFFTGNGEGYGEPNYDACIGIGPMSDLDTNNGNNGVYWIGKDWRIVRREHATGPRTLRGLNKDSRKQYEAIRKDLKAHRVIGNPKEGSVS